MFEVTYDPATHAATFKNVSYNLGDQPITALVVYGPDGTLYAGTDFGVLELPAGSKQWVDARRRTAERRGLRADPLAEGAGCCSPRRTAAAPSRCRCRRAPGPKAKLSKVKPVRLGKKSKFRGSASDAAGVRSAKLEFGDGKSANVKLRAQRLVHAQAPLPQGRQVQGAPGRRRRRGQARHRLRRPSRQAEEAPPQVGRAASGGAASSAVRLRVVDGPTSRYI